MLIKKSLQYDVFPGGQPSRYYPRPTGFDFGDRTSPGFFPCGMIVDKKRSQIFAILSFLKKKRSTFNNYKSRSIFNKILQKTKR